MPALLWQACRDGTAPLACRGLGCGAEMIQMRTEGKMTEKEWSGLCRELVEAAQNTEPETGNTEDAGLYQRFSMNTAQGRAFYRRVPDEMLLAVLKHAAETLGHSPAQKEIFWVWREYVKRRFGKWPYALEKAGLARAAGKGGKSLELMAAQRRAYEELLEEVRAEAGRLCRIPHPSDVPELCGRLKCFTRDWGKVIADAGLDRKFFNTRAVRRIDTLDAESKAQLEQIRLQAERLGRAPMKSEVARELRETLIAKCGSWRNTLYQVGLEPVVRMRPFSSTSCCPGAEKKPREHRMAIQDCYYRVLHPSAGLTEDLGELSRIAEALHRMPDRKEIPAELRKRLQRECGSYANALYQLTLRLENENENEKGNENKKEIKKGNEEKNEEGSRHRGFRAKDRGQG